MSEGHWVDCTVFRCCTATEKLDEGELPVVISPVSQGYVDGINGSRKRVSNDKENNRSTECESVLSEDHYSCSSSHKSTSLSHQKSSTSIDSVYSAVLAPPSSETASTQRLDQKPDRSPQSTTLSESVGDSEPVTCLPGESPISLRGDMPWKDNTRLVPPLRSHDFNDATTATPDSRASPRHAEAKLMDVMKLRRDAESFYLDEKLFCAWVTAETCLRRATRYSENIENAFASDQEKRHADELHKITQEFTQSTTYIGISTKVRLLMDVFKMFGLEERFDISTPCVDSSFYNGWLKFVSKESLQSYSGVAGGDVSPHVRVQNSAGGESTTSLGSPDRHGRKRFNLGHKKGRKSGDIQGGAHTPRKHKFSMRKSKVRDSAVAPLVRAPSGLGALWTEDNQKGLQLAHTINSNGSVSVRIKVKMRIPLFQVLAILNETDFYDKWVPYCKTCTKIVQTSRTSMILQQIAEYPWPLKQKETLSFCFGVDALDELGCILINSHGLAEDSKQFMGHQLPPPPKKIPRVPSSNFLFLLFPVDEGRATITELYCNIDPGITTLRSVILPVIKIVIVRAVRGFFHKIGILATNFGASGYEEKVKDNPEVYDWLKKRIGEGVSLGRFRRGSSVQTLIMDELKDVVDKK